MHAPRLCPALFIAAPASGQGKTTVTAALARMHRNAGRHVRVFKTGPDFLDPLVLEHAVGAPVYQLDLFMGGEAHCRQLLYDAAADADLILVEGVMGLFDGEPSGADLATTFGLPVLAVINATAMAQTFGALALGLATYRSDLVFSGVLANQVASPGHTEMLRESLPQGIRWYGALPRDEQIALPSRHLGLVQAAEIADLEMRIERAAQALAATVSTALPPAIRFDAPTATKPMTTSLSTTASSTTTRPVPQLSSPLLKGQRIAIARDAAFAFLYHANIDCLRDMGASLDFFSPIAGDDLPLCDSVYLPGGYPELHLAALAANTALKNSLKKHADAGKPLVAECGGLLYLLQTLTDSDGRKADMAGLLPGHAYLQKRLANLGLHNVVLPEGEMRGHTFHHSSIESPLEAITQTSGKRGKPEPVYRQQRLHASYLHLYFPSNVDAVARLFSV